MTKVSSYMARRKFKGDCKKIEYRYICQHIIVAEKDLLCNSMANIMQMQYLSRAHKNKNPAVSFKIPKKLKAYARQMG
jgi:hypothetical protein